MASINHVRVDFITPNFNAIDPTKEPPDQPRTSATLYLSPRAQELYALLGWECLRIMKRNDEFLSIINEEAPKELITLFTKLDNETRTNFEREVTKDIRYRSTEREKIMKTNKTHIVYD